MPKTHAYDTVHQLALDQHGVFTTAQAKSLGVHPKTLWAMANRDRINGSLSESTRTSEHL